VGSTTCDVNQVHSGTLAITGVTVLDAVSDAPSYNRSMLIEDGRLKVICSRDELSVPDGVATLEAEGRYAIPGLMNANVHLFGLPTLESLALHAGQYEEVIAEAAQIALKNGLTTVFDTWGPRRFLTAVRDRIERGETPGSRIYCAGNIIGMDGPFSADFFPKAMEVATAAFAKRINAIFVENVGRHLMWLTPEQVAREVRAYIGRGIDFVKYASNDHFPGAFPAFSPYVQAAIVEAAHAAQIPAQAHSLSVEGLRAAIEAGCDLVTHCNITGPVEIPPSTLELFLKHNAGAVIFPFTARRFEAILQHVSEMERTMWLASDANARNLIRSGAMLLMANDGAIWPASLMSDGEGSGTWITMGGEDNLAMLDTGHFSWFEAMEEKGCSPNAMLRAATRNIAAAYRKDADLGTLEPGKVADIVILERNPLEGAKNYRSIWAVIKAGMVVNRDALPLKRMVTGNPEPIAEEESRYVRFIPGSNFPICPVCKPG
jgi:imidazolonepropionase-like amidohydrolase